MESSMTQATHGGMPPEYRGNHVKIPPNPDNYWNGAGYER